MKKEMSEHFQHLSEAEHRVSSMEDELLKTQVIIQQQSKIQKSKMQKIEDLQNWSRHNMQIR